MRTLTVRNWKHEGMDGGQMGGHAQPKDSQGIHHLPEQVTCFAYPPALVHRTLPTPQALRPYAHPVLTDGSSASSGSCSMPSPLDAFPTPSPPLAASSHLKDFAHVLVLC